MKKYMPIFKDGFILLVVSTAFVLVCNQVFQGLKKNTRSDSLVTAILQDNGDSAKEILNGTNGPDATRANRADEFGRTPLMWASYANLADAKPLIETDQKRVAFVQLLAKSGADVNLQDNDGWTALMWAAWSGLPQVAAQLVSQGANLTLTDFQGHTALMIAALRGNTEIVKLLTEKGADKAAVTKNGKKAADLAQEAMAKYPSKAEAYRGVATLLN